MINEPWRAGALVELRKMDLRFMTEPVDSIDTEENEELFGKKN